MALDDDHVAKDGILYDEYTLRDLVGLEWTPLVCV